MVGLELDLHEFNRHRRHSITFGVLSFLVPQTIGTLLCLALGYGRGASFLLGAMFASHTLVAFPIASRLGIVKTGAVTTVLGATLWPLQSRMRTFISFRRTRALIPLSRI